MKKGFTCFLLFAYLFNLSSYWLLQVRMLQSDAWLESRIDGLVPGSRQIPEPGVNNEKNDSQNDLQSGTPGTSCTGCQEKFLVELKIPLHLPYWTDSKGFERLRGQITLGNKSYTYVKRMVRQDTLILMCVPNTRHNELKLISGQVYEHEYLDEKKGRHEGLSLKTVDQHFLRVSLFGSFANAHFQITDSPKCPPAGSKVIKPVLSILSPPPENS